MCHSFASFSSFIATLLHTPGLGGGEGEGGCGEGGGPERCRQCVMREHIQPDGFRIYALKRVARWI
eukprot:261402-Pelagomonas_calceolata.AAC.1